jgi:hypothetical protein
VIDADNSQGFIRALVVQAVWRQRPALHCLTETKLLLGTFKVTVGQTLDQGPDTSDQPRSGGWTATRKKIHGRVEILLGLRCEEHPHRRSLSSMRRKTASAGTP